MKKYYYLNGMFELKASKNFGGVIGLYILIDLEIHVVFINSS